jgi:glycosyltransferase involved in cell wall biosynthesis
MENGKIKAWLPTVRAGSGSDIYTIRLAQALEMRGISCTITWFPLRYEILPICLRNRTPPEGTDIIFANSWNAFAFKRRGVPLVATLHHAEFGSPNAYLSLAQKMYRQALIRQYEMQSFKAADAIVAVSQFAADSLHRTSFADKVEVIHNWIDIDKYRPIEEKEPANKPFRLLFVGKQSRLKGADMLPAIMNQLGDDFHLSIAGTMRRTRGTALPGNMSSLGWLNEAKLIRAYQECDALLFPSRSEGFGYTALEAMACGKPVIASNATALPEIVADGLTGVLCEAGDIEAFVNASRWLAAEPFIARTMGDEGRRRAVEQFSEGKSAFKYSSLIDRLLPMRSSGENTPG